MKNIKQLLVLFLAVSITTFAQEKGIYLVNKKTKDSVFIKESLRTKVATTDGTRIVGELQIVDLKMIKIDGLAFPIASIVKIRRASMFRAIADPIAVILGSMLVGAGALVIFEGGSLSEIGYWLLIPGVPTLLSPFTKDNHINEKWEYQIKN